MSQQTVPEGYRLNEILPGRYVFTYNGDDPDTPSHHICTNCHAAKKNPSILFWQEPSAPSPFDANRRREGTGMESSVSSVPINDTLPVRFQALVRRRNDRESCDPGLG